MDIKNLGNGIWYFENAIPEAAKFLSLIDELDTNEIANTVISPWGDWFDGKPRKDDFAQWDFIKESTMGKDKIVDWDRTYQEFGKIWPKKNMDLTEGHEMVKDVIDLIDKPLKEVIDYYWSQHPNLPKPKYISKNYPIRKYKTGGSMGKHIDINRHTPSMDISILIYLNDDYVGGELYFNDLDIKIKPSAGSVVIFECDKMHQSNFIESGNKIYIPMFVHSKYQIITAFREEYAGMLEIIENEWLT